jgi:hypothetical protein
MIATITRGPDPPPWRGLFDPPKQSRAVGETLWIARLAPRNDGWLTIESELIFVVSGLEP